MGDHLVQPDEHLFEIADRAGFRQANTVWDDPGNASLRAKRKNPGVLQAGDHLFIPDFTPRAEAAATGARHQFVAKLDKLKLRLVLLDFDNVPMAGVAAELIVEDRHHAVVSDADGVIEHTVPRQARQARLLVEALAIDLPIRIGALDPVESPTGWRARLINLGYYRGSLDDDAPDTSKPWRWALEEFQCDQQLKLTGQPDPATLSRLEALHGS
jgi:hypothetical protein